MVKTTVAVTAASASRSFQSIPLGILFTFLLFLSSNNNFLVRAWSQKSCSCDPIFISASSRRKFMYKTLTSVVTVTTQSAILPSISSAEPAATQSQSAQSPSNKYFTQGFGREEYTNSITASRDTNISPKEVYDSIQSSYVRYPLDIALQQNRIPRAWDVGAGAGVSTQTLYNMGYRQIEAVDWSARAWDDNVLEENLPSDNGNYVHFTELDDERFVEDEWRPKHMQKFDVIVFNFGINEKKARAYAQEMLLDDGRLFAPVNTKTDYWMKQTFKVYNKQGDILWSANDVGAWSVQFQPDVTADTCQGIWCAPFNGFQKKR